MVKDFPLGAYMPFDPVRFDAEDFVVLRVEAPGHLRTAAATLIELDTDDRARQGWLARRWRGFLSRALYRLADRIEAR